MVLSKLIRSLYISNLIYLIAERRKKIKGKPNKAKIENLLTFLSFQLSQKLKLSVDLTKYTQINDENKNHIKEKEMISMLSRRIKAYKWKCSKKVEKRLIILNCRTKETRLIPKLI